MPLPCPLLDLNMMSADQFMLRLGHEQRVGSLYYLGIDPRSPDHGCNPQIGLARLLTGWIDILTDRNMPDPCYLPFDFADETTQWLACRRSGSTVDVVFGWAPIEGWAVSPSNFRTTAASLSGFTPSEPLFVQTFYLPRLLSELRRRIGLLSDAHGEESGHPT